MRKNIGDGQQEAGHDPSTYMATKKRDAMELWGHEGPLAEAMRSGFKIGTKAYAVAPMAASVTVLVRHGASWLAQLRG